MASTLNLMLVVVDSVLFLFQRDRPFSETN